MKVCINTCIFQNTDIHVFMFLIPWHIDTYPPILMIRESVFCHKNSHILLACPLRQHMSEPDAAEGKIRGKKRYRYDEAG